MITDGIQTSWIGVGCCVWHLLWGIPKEKKKWGTVHLTSLNLIYKPHVTHWKSPCISPLDLPNMPDLEDILPSPYQMSKLSIFCEQGPPDLRDATHDIFFEHTRKTSLEVISNLGIFCGHWQLSLDTWAGGTEPYWWQVVVIWSLFYKSGSPTDLTIPEVIGRVQQISDDPVHPIYKPGQEEARSLIGSRWSWSGHSSTSQVPQLTGQCQKLSAGSNRSQRCHTRSSTSKI